VADVPAASETGVSLLCTQLAQRLEFDAVALSQGRKKKCDAVCKSLVGGSLDPLFLFYHLRVKGRVAWMCT
jgi:NADPH:quinone reductase-like Zn-dependent oxidoreductase